MPQPANRWAFKEWGAVCAALLAGAQSLIVRKGGIHEGRDGFRIEHPEFWLFATGFHQSTEALASGQHAWQEAGVALQPTGGLITLPAYVVVEAVWHLTSETELPHLLGRQILSPATIDQRFHYKSPGLFVLGVRTYRPSAPLLLPETPHFGGCRSWVDLPAEIETTGLTPILDDTLHAARLQDLRATFAATELA